MKTNRIIFRVRNGIAPSDVLPAGMLAEDLRVERLYDIRNEVASFREHSPMVGITQSDDELFDKEIYVTRSEPEQRLFRTFVAEGSREVAESLVKTLNDDDNVEYVQFDEMNSLYLTPNDARFEELWGIKKIDCPPAWDISQGEAIVVAVIDTGVDYNHPDIKQNMWTDSDGNYGKDFSDDDDDPMDYHGHGSHCAGTIAATINNEIGVVGVAPKVKIMAVKIFPNALNTVCAKGIKYAVDNGAKVLSNSWGPSYPSSSNPTIEDAIDYAHSKGCNVVFAAGNSNDDVKNYYGANHPKVISVAATDQDDARASFSNYGELITVAAPGVDILSLRMNTNQYVKMKGTSMACPHVAGLIALLLKNNNSLTFDQIKQIIQTNADSISTDKPVGAGRINARRSVQTALTLKENNTGGNGAKETSARLSDKSEVEPV